ncbi:MAG: polymer-forming cytoskeletal protein [Burkholderiales bacterium]|nr:polymer-forming cytoskeletal protein [Burkholderiales bacterium]
MLKNSFLGRRDEAAAGHRASPDAPRYAPEPNAAPLNAVAGTPAATARASSGVGPAPVPSTPSPVAAVPGDSGQTGAPRLTVGPNIRLKGAEINDCDTLVVEGHVEASMDSRTLEILKTGSYDGTVSIDVAEIHGKFHGTLTARKKLIVHASGCVSGTVRYGSLLVSEGGVVSGDVAAIDGSGPASPPGNGFAGYPSARNAARPTAESSTANGASHATA